MAQPPSSLEDHLRSLKKWTATGGPLSPGAASDTTKNPENFRSEGGALVISLLRARGGIFPPHCALRAGRLDSRARAEHERADCRIGSPTQREARITGHTYPTAGVVLFGEGPLLPSGTMLDVLTSG